MEDCALNIKVIPPNGITEEVPVSSNPYVLAEHYGCRFNLTAQEQRDIRLKFEEAFEALLVKQFKEATRLNFGAPHHSVILSFNAAEFRDKIEKALMERAEERGRKLKRRHQPPNVLYRLKKDLLHTKKQRQDLTQQCIALYSEKFYGPQLN